MICSSIVLSLHRCHVCSPLFCSPCFVFFIITRPLLWNKAFSKTSELWWLSKMTGTAFSRQFGPHPIRQYGVGGAYVRSCSRPPCSAGGALLLSLFNSQSLFSLAGERYIFIYPLQFYPIKALAADSSPQRLRGPTVMKRLLCVFTSRWHLEAKLITISFWDICWHPLWFSPTLSLSLSLSHALLHANTHTQSIATHSTTWRCFNYAARKVQYFWGQNYKGENETYK